MADEKVLLHYLHTQTFINTATNVIGATTNQTLRTLDTISGDTAYVRKFGTDYLITQVTDIEDPIDVNMTFIVKATDGTTLGSRTGGGAFSAGSTLAASQACKLEISASGGAVTVLASITIDTDVDAGGLAFTCATESVGDGDTLTLFLSDTGSTYYDTLYKYGGDRHTPVLGNTRKSYFVIQTAYDALDSANDGVIVLDSETYDEDLTYNRATTFVLAALGQTPKKTNGIGARVSREVSTQYNNTTAIYFNSNGSDSNDGTWQNPKLTIANAITNRSGKTVVYGGDQAIVNGSFSGFATTTVEINSFTIEVDYGYTPNITGDFTINGVSANGKIDGFIFTGINGSDFNIRLKDGRTGLTYTVQNCSFTGTNKHAFISDDLSAPGAPTGTTVIDRCVIDNLTGPAILIDNNSASAFEYILEMDKCIIKSQNEGIQWTRTGGGSLEVQADITNTIFRECINGYETNDMNTTGAGLRNCLFYANTGRAIIHNTTGADTADRCIFHSNNIGIEIAGAKTYNNCNFFNNTQDSVGAGVTIATWNGNDGVEVSLLDPNISVITDVSTKFGLQPLSTLIRSVSNEDIGPVLRNITIAEDDIVINGFDIDGQNQYNEAIGFETSSNRTGLIVKWCDIHDYEGLGINLYSGGDTDSTISNCKIYDSATGAFFDQDGNTIDESLIFTNLIQGLFTDSSNQTIDHNVFYNTRNGIRVYIDSNNVTIKNSIFHDNSSLAIQSSKSIAVTFNCITDDVDTLVDISSATNISADPLFVSQVIGSEDFNIKTIAAGFLLDSPCKDAGESDIGAYTISRSVDADSWQKFQFEHNPENVDMENVAKGLISMIDALGALFLYAKGHKRVLPMIWANFSYTTEIQWKTIDYLNTLIPTRENGLSKEQAKFRAHFAPTSFIFTGTSSTVSASGKTLTDLTQSWVRNELKGFHVGIKFASGTGTGTISAAGKTLTVSPSPSWTIDEWIGHYIYNNNNYYYIQSNTASVLTLSDPDGTLTDQASIDWSIEKYFKIKSNIATVLTLEDDNSELTDGTFDWYIDFIVCRLQKSEFKFTQNRFSFTRQHSKTGYELIFEEG